MDYSCYEEEEYYMHMQAQAEEEYWEQQEQAQAEEDYWSHIETCIQDIIYAGITPAEYEKEYNKLTKEMTDKVKKITTQPTHICPHCQSQHIIEYGSAKQPDGSYILSDTLGFVKCPYNDNLYVVTIKGESIYPKKPDNVVFMSGLDEQPENSIDRNEITAYKCKYCGEIYEHYFDNIFHCISCDTQICSNCSSFDLDICYKCDNKEEL